LRKSSGYAERNRSGTARLAKSRIAHCDDLRGVFVEFPIGPATPGAGDKEAENLGFTIPDCAERESG